VNGDHWLPGGIFVHYGRRYGVTWHGKDGEVIQTVCMDAANMAQQPPSLPALPVETPKEVVADTPTESVTELSVTKKPRKLKYRCPICGVKVRGKRKDRLFCSPNCRQRACRGKQLVMAGIKC
jgi:hypothetical protein